MVRQLALITVLTASFQIPPPPPPAQPAAPKPAPITKLGPNLFGMGPIKIDTRKREVIVPGFVNDVTVVEFVANTKGGYKAYESALTLDTNAVTFNAALLLIGLDPTRGRPSRMQFDPTPPRGDPVELVVEWDARGDRRREPIEVLLFDQRGKGTLRPGPWVYTGSTFVDAGDGPRYLAEVDGVLIGLMHGPQAVIDNPRNDAIDGFGAFVMNPNLGLAAGSQVTLTVKALAPSG